MRLPKQGALFLAVLLIAAAARFPLISTAPLCQDDAVYGQIITELLANPLQVIPHYLGSPAAWKPPAGFYTYAAITAAISAAIPRLPIEYAFRAAPALLAALSVFTLYFLLRELFDERQAFFAAITFALANQTLTTANSLLLDSALLFFGLLALFCYVKSLKSKTPDRWLIVAASFSALAALTKTYAAFFIPITAFALYYYYDKRRLQGRVFISSLLAAPAAIIVYAGVYAVMVPDGLRDILSAYIYDALGRVSGSLAQQVAGNSTDLFERMFPWGLFAIAGIALLNLKRKEDRFAVIWAAASLIPLASSTGYFWYYLPAVPPLSLFAARAFSKLKPAHAYALIAFLALVSLTIYASFNEPENAAREQMSAGLALGGSASVLTLTERGVPAVMHYKFQGEQPPNYAGAKQMVADPWGLESYTVFGMSQLVFSEPPANGLANPTPLYISSLIECRRPDAVLMEKEIYLAYSQAPIPGYALTFQSGDGNFYVIKRIQ